MTFLHRGGGILQKQMLFVNSWDTPELVTFFFHACSIMHECSNFTETSTFGFGRGSLSVLIRNVYCRGYESNLGECTYDTTGLSNCVRYGGDIIGVQCFSSKAFNWTP